MPDTNTRITRTRRIGGLFGLGASDTSVEFILQKTHYAPGDTVNVRFLIDNSLCTCPVLGIKLKLERFLFGVTFDEDEADMDVV